MTVSTVPPLRADTARRWELVRCTRETCGHEYVRAARPRLFTMGCNERRGQSRCGAEMIVLPLQVAVAPVEHDAAEVVGAIEALLFASSAAAALARTTPDVVEAAQYEGQATAYSEAVRTLIETTPPAITVSDPLRTTPTAAGSWS